LRLQLLVEADRGRIPVETRPLQARRARSARRSN
jgi:hypothetical protein